MLNLLFISDSPKAGNIKRTLQPVLKVIIDVVKDFDHGLKDVFEKRPTIVCIQDKIGTVTGESVARHIQMLLGNGAPKFILLHNGNGKAETIKGVYEHSIDMSQSEGVIVEDIKNTLKTLLGTQWDKIYIPPELLSDSGKSIVSPPEVSRLAADKLVDDFLSDLKSSVGDDQPSPVSTKVDDILQDSTPVSESDAPAELENAFRTAAADRAQSINEDLAELLLMEANERKLDKRAATFAAVEPEAVPLPPLKPPKPAKVIPETPSSAGSVASGISSDSLQVAANSVTAPPGKNIVKPSLATLAPPATKPEIPVPPLAAEFRISQGVHSTEEPISEDHLPAFEEIHRPQSFFLRYKVVIAIVLVVSAVGAWFVVTKKLQMARDSKQHIISRSAKPDAPESAPVPDTQKTLPTPVPQVVAAPELPTFIPKDGRDGSYAVNNPGWERYVGKNAEFRVFTVKGRIKALQVLSVNNAPIAEPFIKSVLQEFVGSPVYQITSRNKKAKIHIESGNIENKGEIIIYRKNRAVKAFVVSIN